MITTEEIDQVFGKLNDLYEFHKNFVFDMNYYKYQTGLSSIWNVFEINNLDNCTLLQQLYANYAQNYVLMLDKLSTWICKTDEANNKSKHDGNKNLSIVTGSNKLTFREWLQRQMIKYFGCNSSTLPFFLSKPLARPTNYLDFLKEFGYDDKALSNRINAIFNNVNEHIFGKGQMSGIYKAYTLSIYLTIDDLCLWKPGFNLVNDSRRLIVISKNFFIYNQAKQKENVLIYLFNDLIVWTKKCHQNDVNKIQVVGFTELKHIVQMKTFEENNHNEIERGFSICLEKENYNFQSNDAIDTDFDMYNSGMVNANSSDDKLIYSEHKLYCRKLTDFDARDQFILEIQKCQNTDKIEIIYHAEPTTSPNVCDNINNANNATENTQNNGKLVAGDDEAYFKSQQGTRRYHNNVSSARSLNEFTHSQSFSPDFTPMKHSKFKQETKTRTKSHDFEQTLKGSRINTPHISDDDQSKLQMLSDKSHAKQKSIRINSLGKKINKFRIKPPKEKLMFAQSMPDTTNLSMVVQLSSLPEPKAPSMIEKSASHDIDHHRRKKSKTSDCHTESKLDTLNSDSHSNSSVISDPSDNDEHKHTHNEIVDLKSSIDEFGNHTLFDGTSDIAFANNSTDINTYVDDIDENSFLTNWWKQFFHFRKIYTSSLTHLLDITTDISVIGQFWSLFKIEYIDGGDCTEINPAYLLGLSLTVFFLYRTVSTISIIKLTQSYWHGFLQFIELELYVALLVSIKTMSKEQSNPQVRSI